MWTAIMGAISAIAFSVLIILNIANINTDPPYWVAGTTILIAIGIYFSQKQYAGINRWRLLSVHVLFLALYLMRVHTVPYFGLPLEGMLGDGFFADGPWGRMWVFYGGFAALHILTMLWESKFLANKEAK
jgi:hypothetical protein